MNPKRFKNDENIVNFTSKIPFLEPIASRAPTASNLSIDYLGKHDSLVTGKEGKSLSN